MGLSVDLRLVKFMGMHYERCFVRNHQMTCHSTLHFDVTRGLVTNNYYDDIIMESLSDGQTVISPDRSSQSNSHDYFSLECRNAGHSRVIRK